jgi:hypothetical protein
MYDPPLVEQQEPWVKPQINLRSSSFFRIFDISRPQPREKSSENKKESWFDKILRKKPQKEVHTSFKVRDIMQFTIFLQNSWIFSQE